MEVLQKTFRSTVLLLTSLFVLAFVQNAEAQCGFNNLVWEIQNCENGSFYLSFSFENPSADEAGFIMQRLGDSGGFLGAFAYGNASYTVGPFPASGGGTNNFRLLHANNLGCNTTFNVGGLFCNPNDSCNMFAAVQQSDCGEQNEFNFMLTVIPTNPGESGFTVSENGEVIATFDYNSNGGIEYSISTVSSGVVEDRILTITDVDNGCETTTTLEAEACSLCSISSALITECNAEGEYFIEISVAHANSDVGQFVVTAFQDPDVQWGPFDYGEETYIVGPITVGDDNNNTIYVNDADPEIEGCFASKNFIRIDCDNLCGIDVTDYYVLGSDAPICEEFGIVAFFEEATTYHNFGIFVDGQYYYSGGIGDSTYGMFPVDGGPVTMTFVSESVVGCETTLIIQPEEYCYEPDPNACEVEITSALITECNADFEYFVDISASQMNSNTGQFIVTATYNQGVEWGPFDYGEEVYSIGPISSAANFSANRIYAIDTEFASTGDCFDSYFFGFIECDNLCDLEISGYSVNVNSEAPCGEFGALFQFVSEPNGDEVVDIYADDVFLLSDTPENYVPVPVIQGDGVNPVTITFVSDAIANCETSITIQPDEYCDGAIPLTCNLDISSVTTTECTTGEFFAELAITSESSSSDVFNILIGVDVFSGQVYGQGTYTIGPISENSSGSYIASVNDPADDSCYDSFTFEVECTPICSLTPSNFAPINCETNAVYFIASIETEDTGSQGFTVMLNGESYGTYEYEVINYEFGPFPYFPGEEYNFEFIDNEIGESCVGTYTYPAFELENCSDFCFVNLDALEVTDCNADGEFFINIEVSTSLNSPSTSFTAFLGTSEEEFGPFDYGQDFYTIGPLTPDGTVNDYLIVRDASGVESCGAHELLFSDPDCGLNFDCAIGITSLEVGECNADGQYMVDFQVSSENPASASFRVYINDDNWSYQFTYDGADTYSIGPFDAADGLTNLMIHDSLDEECTDNTSFAAPDCSQEECGFNDLSLDFQGCNEEVGTMFLVDFNAVGTGNLGFDVTVNGEFLSFHLYADMPVTINIPAQPGNFAVLNFCDNDNPDCCTEAFADVANCDETGECGLNMNGAQFTDCVDGSFNIFVPTINTFGVLSETFNAYINDEFVGNFPYNQEDWLFGPVTLNGETPLVLSILDSENETCPASLNFGTVNPCENTPDCTIAIPVFELYECNDEGQIYVDFEVTGLEAGEQFTAFGNGEQYGTFTYGETFYTVGPFDGNGSTYELIISSLAQDDCTVFIGFDAPSCETNNCQINIPFVEVGECNADGMFFVDFEMLPIEGEGTVEITGNGQNYGIYDYNLPLYTVGPFDGTETATYELIITDTENPDCIQILTFASANCTVEDCNMSLTFDEYGACFGDNQFYVIVSVTNANVEEGSFTFIGNGETYGTEEYGAGSYAVGPFDGVAGVIYELLAIDNQDTDCSVELIFESQECETEPTCEIDITFVENYECNEAAQFFVDFGVAGLAEGDEFSVFGNGENYGTFVFGETSYTVGPFNGDGANYELIVSDLTQDDCIAVATIEGQNCLDNFPCGFNDISTEYNGCSADGVYFYTLDFIPVNTTNAFFDLNINGGTSSYAYADLPIDIQIFPTNEGVLTICDNDNPDCCQEVLIDLPECETEMCNIDVIEYTLTDCDEIGNFYVDFSIGVANPNSDLFYAFHNGTTYGPFEFGQATYQIGPLDGLETAVFEIIIYVDGNEECTTEIVFDSANCGGNEDCALDIVEFETIDCDSDNQFYVQFWVVANNPEAATFVATGNGENYGTFNYEEGFYTVGPFDGNLDPVWELIVTDTENPDCSTFITFVSPDCNDEVCNLEVADYFTTECNDEGQYFVNIYLTETSFGSTFQVFNDGESYGPYAYGEEVYTVGPFNSGIDDFNLELFDTGFDQCFDNIEIDAVDCPISDCFISDLEVETGECNAENTYSVTINFVYDDIGGEFFNLIYQEEVIGTYETANLPITIENFDGNAEVETLTVCMTDLEECCMSIDFLTPQCEGLIIWPGDGNFDGITNNMDILNLGIAYGFTGTARATDNVGWMAQDAFAWENNFASGINYVHADTDGNGEVSMADRDIVSDNYDLTHDEVTPFVALEPNDSSPELFVDMPDPFELQQGMEFNAPVIFGLEDLPVDNVYGLAFTLRYDPEIIDPSSISLEFPISWLGFPQTNLMTFEYHDIDLGEIDVAITKIDQNNVSGWGEILNFIGIIDNIAGKTEIFIEIDNVTAILSNEERFPINTPIEITTITSTENINELQGFELFPNPTNDIVRIKNETGLSLQSIQISDLNGKLLQTVHGEDSFDLSRLPSGVYMAKVVFEGKTVYRKLVRM